MSEQLPLFPLGTVLIPGMILPLHIFERRYRDMLAARIDADPVFGVVLIRSGREVGEQPEVHDLGTAATLLRAIRHRDGRYDIAVRGVRRFRSLRGDWKAGYLTADIEWLDDDEATDDDGSLVSQVSQAFAEYLDLYEAAARVTVDRTDLGRDPLALGYALTVMLPLAPLERQRLLAAETPSARLRYLLLILRRERSLLTATGVGGAAMDYPGAKFSQN